jgi:hypothetical protein
MRNHTKYYRQKSAGTSSGAFYKAAFYRRPKSMIRKLYLVPPQARASIWAGIGKICRTADHGKLPAAAHYSLSHRLNSLFITAVEDIIQRFR